MENTYDKIATQVPNLLALGGIVWMFLKHIAAQTTEQRAFFERLHSENMEARRHEIDVIEENSATLGQVSEVLKSYR